MDTKLPWIATMFKAPKGPRLRARQLEKRINEIAVKTGKPVTHGVIDRQSMSLIFQEGKLFIDPEDMKSAEFMGIPFTCVDRHPKFPLVPIVVLTTETAV